MEYEGHCITYITEFRYGRLFKSFNSASNYFLLHISTWIGLPQEISFFVKVNVFEGYHKNNNQKVDLIQYINTIPGEWYIFLNKKQGFYQTDNGFIDTLVWVCPWADSIIKSFQYLILDSSFKVVKPYAYSIPLMVKNNMSIPVGLSVAVSEKKDIYSRFLSHVNLKQEMELLCDLGRAIESLCKEFSLRRYVCHRHLIEIFSPNSLAGFLMTKLCQLKSEEEYINFMKYWVPVLNHLLQKNKIPKNFDTFIRYIGYKHDEKKQEIAKNYQIIGFNSIF